MTVVTRQTGETKRLYFSRDRGATPTQQRLNSRNEHARLDRFDHIVVGTELEPDDVIDVVITSRQHENRQI